jgi:hypothetical protein
MAQQLDRDRSAPPAELPQPGDFDAGLERAAVLARGPALAAGRPFPLTIDVPLEDLRALMAAAAAEDLDAREYVERAVRRLAGDLRSGSAVPRMAGGVPVV